MHERTSYIRSQISLQELGENDETIFLESDTCPNRNATKLKKNHILGIRRVGALSTQ
jgi:hypothetical protein